MKSDNKSHPTDRHPTDPYRDRNPNRRYEGEAYGERGNVTDSPNYHDNLSHTDPSYRDAYKRESLHNKHLARENAALRDRHAVERDRIVSRHQADTGRNFLLGVLIIGIAALGFGIFYYAGRSETEEQPALQTPIEVPEQPEAETPDINIELPDNPPDVQLPEISVPDVDVQVPDATGGAENPAPAPTENSGADAGTAPAGTAPVGDEALPANGETQQ
ncbi:MAG: hypothetical protein ACTS2F_16855 [Thainema sp.]